MVRQGAGHHRDHRRSQRLRAELRRRPVAGRTILPLAGRLLPLLAACLILIGIWPDIDSASYWKLTASVCFFAVACAHLSMLFMANLAACYRWAYLVADLLIFGLATLLAAGIAWEFFNAETYVRLTGAVSILVAAITILIPVFHFLSRDQIAATTAEANPPLAIDEEIARLKQHLVELEDQQQDALKSMPWLSSLLKIDESVSSCILPRLVVAVGRRPDYGLRQTA